MSSFLDTSPIPLACIWRYLGRQHREKKDLKKRDVKMVDFPALVADSENGGLEPIKTTKSVSSLQI